VGLGRSPVTRGSAIDSRWHPCPPVTVTASCAPGSVGPLWDGRGTRQASQAPTTPEGDRRSAHRRIGAGGAKRPRRLVDPFPRSSRGCSEIEHWVNREDRWSGLLARARSMAARDRVTPPVPGRRQLTGVSPKQLDHRLNTVRGLRSLPEVGPLGQPGGNADAGAETFSDGPRLAEGRAEMATTWPNCCRSFSHCGCSCVAGDRSAE
jgi:hypothetical protein